MNEFDGLRQVALWSLRGKRGWRIAPCAVKAHKLPCYRSVSLNQGKLGLSSGSVRYSVD